LAKPISHTVCARGPNCSLIPRFARLLGVNPPDDVRP
jgi:hypothetical protein